MVKNAASKEKSCLFPDYLKENALSANMLICETEKLSFFVSFLFTYNVKEIKFTN